MEKAAVAEPVASAVSTTAAAPGSSDSSATVTRRLWHGAIDIPQHQPYPLCFGGQVMFICRSQPRQSRRGIATLCEQLYCDELGLTCGTASDCFLKYEKRSVGVRVFAFLYVCVLCAVPERVFWVILYECGGCVCVTPWETVRAPLWPPRMWDRIRGN